MVFQKSETLPVWINKGENSPEDYFVRNVFYLMKEIGISYEDVSNMPVPALMMLIDELDRHAKNQERQMKKARKK